MAKQYSAKITLQDNWTSVIGKAIAETRKLEAEFNKIKAAKANPQIAPQIDKTSMRAFQNDLNRLNRSRVSIGARMDASVHSTLNAINSRITPNKTIRIQARDEVTRTVTNLERNIFSMQNAMNVGLRNPFGNMSISARGAMSHVSSLLNGMTALSNLSRLATGSSALAALAGAGGATVLARGGNRGMNIPTTDNGHRGPLTTDNYDKWAAKHPKTVAANARFDGSNSVGQYVRTSFNDFGRSSINAGPYMKQYNALNRANGVQRASVTHQNDRMILGTDFADTVTRQKQYMQNRFGTQGSAGKFTRTSANFMRGGELFETDAMIRPMNKLEIAWRNTVSKITRSGQFKSLSSNFTGVINGMTSKMNSFRNRLSNNRVSRFVVDAVFRGERAMFGVKKVMSQIKGVVSKPMEILMKAKDGASKVINTVKSGIAKIKANPVVSFMIKGVDKATGVIKGVLGGMAKLAAGGALAIGAAAGVAVKSAISGAMSLEQQKVSMAHFMNFNDKQKNGGKGTMTNAQINGSVDKYVGDLRSMANGTPFGTNEVVTAGARAMNVMNGDTAGAMDLTKISADMAALNPGKSIGDAMEALADAKTGEFERLKEFGLKISQADFKASVGKGENDQLTPEETQKAYQNLMNDKLKPMFGGGAGDLAGTATGMISTIKGKFTSGLTDIGTMFLPQIKTGLGAAMGYMDTIMPKVMNFFEVLSGKKQADSPGMKKIMEIFKQVGNVIQQVITASVGIVRTMMPVIQNLMIALAPTFKFVGGLIAKIMATVSGKIGVVAKIINHLSTIWTSVWPLLQSVLQTAWSIIEPIFNTLMDVAGIIADIFMLVWPGIQATLEALWAGIKPIFDMIADALNGISWVADKVGKFFDWLLGNGDEVTEKAKNVETNTGKNGDKPKEKAVGMAYIPYNGYKISAHRGEAILTRQEADAWREGRSGGSAANSGMNVTIHVDGSGDPDLVAQKVVDKLQLAAANM